MIQVNEVYDTVKQLMLDDANGHFSGEDFNRVQRLAQNTLMNYYIKRLQSGLKVSDALLPFTNEMPLSYIPASGQMSLPSDYRHRLEVLVSKTPTIEYQPARHVKYKEIGGTTGSTVRKPSVDNVIFTISGNTIQFYPGGNGLVTKMTYLRNPADAVYATTIDSTNIVENYNPAASVNFEWNEYDRGNIVDLIMYHLGVQTRAGEIISYLNSKNQATILDS